MEYPNKLEIVKIRDFCAAGITRDKIFQFGNEKPWLISGGILYCARYFKLSLTKSLCPQLALRVFL